MRNNDFHNEVKRLFFKGMDDAFYVNSDSCSTQIKEINSLDQFEENEVFLLTISALDFRVFVLIHFSNAEPCRRLIADSLNANDGKMDDARFYDYLGELGNTLCGALKRDINNFVPSLGMSTPNRLNHDCLNYINTQKPEQKFHALVNDQNDETLCAASIYICTDQELQFDYSQNKRLEEVDDTGELELF
jgi:hypothetical protein